MTKKEFVACMDILAHGVGKPIPATTLEVWFEILGELSQESLRAAVKQSLTESQYPGLPAVGLLHRLATDMPEPTEVYYARLAREAQARRELNRGR